MQKAGDPAGRRQSSKCGSTRQVRTERAYPGPRRAPRESRREFPAPTAQKATTEAPAREFSHPLTDREMQRQARAVSNDTAQHATASANTERRKVARRATERASRVPKEKSCTSAPEALSVARAQEFRHVHKHHGSAARSRRRIDHSRPRHSREDPNSRATRPLGISNATGHTAPRGSWRLCRPRTRMCPSARWQGLSVALVRVFAARYSTNGYNRSMTTSSDQEAFSLVVECQKLRESENDITSEMPPILPAHPLPPAS